MNSSNFFITLFFITSVIFSTLFAVYYFRLDQFKKDKELLLNYREEDLNRREKRVEQTENCVQRLTKCESVSEEIRKLLKSNIDQEQQLEEYKEHFM